MLHICIPVYNEAPTVGVLLWRIRKVFQDYSREYDVTVYDDASTDETAATLAPYATVLPLTVIHADKREGYGHALNVLCSSVVRRTRYPRRDAMVVMQGDFTDRPDMLPDLLKRFEGGADIVIGEREQSSMPTPVRRLARVGPWVIRPFVSAVSGADPLGGYRLYRIALLRDYVKSFPGAELVSTDGWAANVELFVKLAPFARRVEKVAVSPRYDVRPRATRVHPFADAVALYRAGRAARGWRTRPAAPVGATQ